MTSQRTKDLMVYMVTSGIAFLLLHAFQPELDSTWVLVMFTNTVAVLTYELLFVTRSQSNV